MQLGRLHERREEIDSAWSCYDHVQTLMPHLLVRDEFLGRLTERMDGGEKTPWSGPKLEHRTAFLEQMEELNKRVRQETNEPDVKAEEDDVETFNVEEKKLTALIESSNISEAFFMARRLVASGEEWAEPYLEQCRSMM